MLKLLEHSVAQRTDWSCYEKCLRWNVILLAWWGSFRIGELLTKQPNQFNADMDFLASDLTFIEGSVACWIRCPKIPKCPMGDTVEVWQVEQRPDLDPITALKVFMKLREGVFGKAEALPVFLHENGKLFSKAEFNQDLTKLLAFLGGGGGYKM